jgi:hypothetical protein
MGLLAVDEALELLSVVDPLGVDEDEAELLSVVDPIGV